MTHLGVIIYFDTQESYLRTYFRKRALHLKQGVKLTRPIDYIDIPAREYLGKWENELWSVQFVTFKKRKSAIFYKGCSTVYVTSLFILYEYTFFSVMKNSAQMLREVCVKPRSHISLHLLVYIINRITKKHRLTTFMNTRHRQTSQKNPTV